MPVCGHSALANGFTHSPEVGLKTAQNLDAFRIDKMFN